MSRSALADGLRLQYRASGSEIHILHEDDSTWQVGLRLGDGMQVERVWQWGGLLFTRIHSDDQSFMLASRNGTQWKNV
jgi:hypothetical protein